MGAVRVVGAVVRRCVGCVAQPGDGGERVGLTAQSSSVLLLADLLVDPASSSRAR
jgi:hypothetical protein